MKTLGQKFRILRQKQGFNQKVMADLLKISIPAYSKLETGMTDPNFSRINQIAAIHHVNINELLVVGEESVNEQEKITENLKIKVKELEDQVINLQRKLIAFYDEDDQRKQQGGNKQADDKL